MLGVLFRWRYECVCGRRFARLRGVGTREPRGVRCPWCDTEQPFGEYVDAAGTPQDPRHGISVDCRHRARRAEVMTR